MVNEGIEVIRWLLIRFGVLCEGVSFGNIIFFVFSNELLSLYLERFWVKNLVFGSGVCFVELRFLYMCFGLVVCV